MKAYRIGTDVRLSPFGERPQDLPILNRPLSWHQDSVIGSMGMEMVDVNDPFQVEGECITFPDHMYFTENLLKEFVSRSRMGGRGATCCVRKGSMTLRSIATTMSVKDEGEWLRYALSYLPDNWGDGLESTVIDADEDEANVRFPEHMVQGRDYRVPLTSKSIYQIEHWSNLWSANISGILGRMRDLQTLPGLRKLGLALRARSMNPWKVSSKNVIVGKGCDIHHRAYLENAVLGDNVEVGAGTVIRGAHIGDDAVIANNASLLISVIGDRCAVRDGSCLQFSLMFPDAVTSARFLNCVTMGRDSFVGDCSAMTDFKFNGGNITVMKDGHRVDTGGEFLGPCVGHRSYIGSGVVVGPAREIPNDSRVMVGRDRILLSEDMRGDFELVEKVRSG